MFDALHRQPWRYDLFGCGRYGQLVGLVEERKEATQDVLSQHYTEYQQLRLMRVLVEGDVRAAPGSHSRIIARLRPHERVQALGELTHPDDASLLTEVRAAHRRVSEAEVAAVAAPMVRRLVARAARVWYRIQVVDERPSHGLPPSYAWTASAKKSGEPKFEDVELDD